MPAARTGDAPRQQGEFVGVKSGTRSRRHRTHIIALAVMFAGCARIGQRPPVHSDRLLRVVPVESLTGGAIANVAQSGTELSLRASHVCNLQNDRVVYRTTTTEAYNKSPAADWLLGGAAVAAGGVGAILVTDAKNTYTNDRTSRTYNPAGPNQERAYGYGLVGVGAALGTIVLVDVIRASGTKIERREVTVPGEIVQRAARCQSRPYANAQVAGKLGRLEFTLGTTSAQGKLEVDLDQVVPPEIYLSALASKLEIQVSGHVAGTASLKALFLRREAREFEGSGVAECREATKLAACEGVERFLARYPHGPHGAEAQRALTAATPRLAALKDDLAWSALRVEDCTNSNAAEPESILAACQPLRAYLDQFPEGRHAKETQTALASGENKAADLASKIERAASAQRASSARRLSDSRIKSLLIQESIAEYGGNCPCPYNSASNGSSCGRRSAYSRAGGAEPLCYPRDVTADMVQSYRDAHGE
jgi:hypothetical protein